MTSNFYFICAKVYNLILNININHVIVFFLLIFRKEIAECILKITRLSLNKDGIEIKKIITQVQSFLSETQLLTATVYIPLLDILSRNESLSPYIIKNKLDIRNEIQKFILENDVKNEHLEKKLSSLNYSILKDVITSIVKNPALSNSLLDYSFDEFLYEEVMGENYKCNPDIDAITDAIKNYHHKDNDSTLLDIDYIEYILKEARHFQKNNDFIDINKLIQCMDKAINIKTQL